MRISDWSSDVCSSDLRAQTCAAAHHPYDFVLLPWSQSPLNVGSGKVDVPRQVLTARFALQIRQIRVQLPLRVLFRILARRSRCKSFHCRLHVHACARRSEEHTSELQSLMRISYAVFCLNKKQHSKTHTNNN